MGLGRRAADREVKAGVLCEVVSRLWRHLPEEEPVMDGRRWRHQMTTSFSCPPSFVTLPADSFNPRKRRAR